MKFAINQMTAPKLSARELIDLAVSLGCIGVEIRNDLIDKGLSTTPFFDGETPEDIGAYARSNNIEILGLSEVYGFNDWSDEIERKVNLLIAQAKACGARSISLIPLNNGRRDPSKRMAMTQDALSQILPKLKAADLMALVEPLGFPSSSLHLKAEANAAIDAVEGAYDYLTLVHDTFHHHLASEAELYPHHTGIVHISGVVNPALAIDEMQDEHRILVDEHDRLGNIAQIKTLLERGYTGAFSFEVFSPDVHALDDIESALRTSMDFIRSAVEA